MLPAGNFQLSRTHRRHSRCGYRGIKRSEYVDKATGKRDYRWDESQWTETGWTLIRRVEDEFIDVPERGFFPRGEPEELYTWPERDAQALARSAPPTTAMSGEPASHSGTWSLFNCKDNSGYVDLKQGEFLPLKDGQPVKWILIRRADGGSTREPKGRS